MPYGLQTPWACANQLETSTQQLLWLMFRFCATAEQLQHISKDMGHMGLVPLTSQATLRWETFSSYLT